MRGHLAGSLLALLLLGGCAEIPRDFVPERQTSSEDGLFRAGTGAVDFTPGKGYPLAGYGDAERRVHFPFYWGLGWPGRLALRYSRWRHESGEPSDFLVGAAGAHDPLQAKALVFVPEHGPPFAIVRIDAVESTRPLHDRIVELTKDLGFSTESVLLAATHTHSGVGGYMAVPFAELAAMDVYRPETEERIAHAAAEAIRVAHGSARPASIGFARARDQGPEGKPLIAKNRRARRFPGEIDEDDLDRDVELILVRDRDAREPIATVANYAVHGTVLGVQNRYFSSDLVAPVESALAKCAGGGEGLFLNGAEGDVGPRAGSGGLIQCREEGDAIAQVCSSAIASATFSPRARFRGATGLQGFGDAFLYFSAGDRERFYEGDSGAGKFVTAPLTLPLNAVIWLLGFTNVRLALTWTFTAGIVFDMSSYGGSDRFRGGGLRITTQADDAFLFAAPCEALHAVGLELKKRARASGATRALVVGLADDAASYVAPPAEYFRGGYEATMTLFGPDMQDRLYDLERGVLEGVGFAPSGAPAAPH
jgi:hypothetical protein